MGVVATPGLAHAGAVGQVQVVVAVAVGAARVACRAGHPLVEAAR